MMLIKKQRKVCFCTKGTCAPTAQICAEEKEDKEDKIENIFFTVLDCFLGLSMAA